MRILKTSIYKFSRYKNQILNIKNKVIFINFDKLLYTTSYRVAGFKGSLELVFPKAKAQRCVIHLVRNLYNICPKKKLPK